MNKLVIENAVLLSEVSTILSEGRSVVLSVKGNSMRPFLFGSRDSVTLEKKEKYAVGDMVLSQIRPGTWVLHRLVADGNVLTLKGDGNLDGTEHCRQKDIAGYVTAIHKPSGRTVDCLTHRFSRLSRLWRESPRIIRRIVLKSIRIIRPNES